MEILKTWERISRLPAGRWIFTRFIALKIPYSASTSPLVEHLEAGYARVSMRQKRRVSNHLNSVHAVALMNLAELCSGLALVGGLPKDMRGILTGFRIEYSKKSRGRITAESRVALPTRKERQNFEVVVNLRDEAGNAVCQANATWLIGPAT